MSISVCNFCRQLESDDVSELNDSMNVQQSSDSCALQEMQKVIIIFIFIHLCLCASFCALLLLVLMPCLLFCNILVLGCIVGPDYGFAGA